MAIWNNVGNVERETLEKAYAVSAKFNFYVVALTCQKANGSVPVATSVVRYVLNSCSTVCDPLTHCVISIVGRLKRDVSKQDWATPRWGMGGEGAGLVSGIRVL